MSTRTQQDPLTLHLISPCKCQHHIWPCVAAVEHLEHTFCIYMKQWFFTVFSSSSEFNDPELQPKCDYMNKRLYFKKYYNKLRISSFESVFYYLKCFSSPTVVILVRMQHLHIIIWTTNKQNNVFTSQETSVMFLQRLFPKIRMCIS